MQWLAEISVRRPVFAWVMILVVMVTGCAGFLQLGVDRFPPVEIPVVVVVTVMPGAAPEELEREVTDRVEEALSSLSGIDRIQSSSAESVSTVVVMFELDKDVDVAVQEVRDALAPIERDLPPTAQESLVQKFDPDAVPILLLAIDGPLAHREITEYADKQLKPQLENVLGVGGVTVLGGAPRQINVWLDPDRLAAHGLLAAHVQRAIATESVAAPAGPLDDGATRVSVRLEGRVQSVKQLSEIIVTSAGGHPVRLQDVATVEDGAAEPETMAIRDGRSAVVLAIRKQSGANTVAVVDALTNRLERIRPTLPTGFRVDVVTDNAESTRTSLNAIYEHIFLGGLFASVVVLLFLGSFRSTFITAIAIPTSVVGTFGLLWIGGFTLNTISMLALALAVGIVIDDAIVVMENIHRYIHEEGVKPFPAAILATREIGLAVLATTFSLVAVFLPVAFVGGIPGRFLSSFGWTMTFSVLVSLFVSFTLTPMLSARLLKPNPPGARKPLLERMSDAFNAPIERVYMAVLGLFVRWRILAVGLAAVTFLSILPLGYLVPKGFLPKSDEAQFLVSLRAPEGTSMAVTELHARRISEAIRASSPDDVESVLVTVADNNERARNAAAITVKLVPPQHRAAGQEEVITRVREHLAARVPADLTVSVGPIPLFGGGGAEAKLIQMAVRGPEIEELSRVSEMTKEALNSVEGAVDVETSLVVGRPEVQAMVDRDRAGDLGVSVGDVASTLQIALGGLDVGTYPEGGEQFDIHLKAAPSDRRTLADLSQWHVPSTKHGRVPLTDVIDTRAGEGPSSIERLNRQRYVLLSANLGEGYAQSDVMNAFMAKLDAMEIPEGYTVEPTGQSEELGKLLYSFGLAFAMSIIFMYLVLAAQFESWVHPITILLSLPLTVPFALASALLLGFQLDIYTMLGILVLFGVVKKNSILQIDRIIQLRASGMPRTEAVLQGSRDRLRPILMTTIAFVAGMVPLLIANGVGAGLSQAIAGVIIGGQTFSLVLTLLVTPVAYTILDDLVTLVGRVFRGRRTTADTGADSLHPDALDAIAANVATHPGGAH